MCENEKSYGWLYFPPTNAQICSHAACGHSGDYQHPPSESKPTRAHVDNTCKLHVPLQSATRSTRNTRSSAYSRWRTACYIHVGGKSVLSRRDLGNMNGIFYVLQGPILAHFFHDGRSTKCRRLAELMFRIPMSSRCSRVLKSASRFSETL